MTHTDDRIFFMFWGDDSSVPSFCGYYGITGIPVCVRIFYKKFDLWKNIKKLVIPYAFAVDCGTGVLGCAASQRIRYTGWTWLKQFVIGYTYDTMAAKRFLSVLPGFSVVGGFPSAVCHCYRIEKENLLVKGCLCWGFPVVLSSALGDKTALSLMWPWPCPSSIWGELARNYQKVSYRHVSKIWLLAAFVTLWFRLWNHRTCLQALSKWNDILIISSLSMFVVIGAPFSEHYLRSWGKVFVIYGKYSFAVLCSHSRQSCLVHSPETNIYLLLLYELFLAIILVIVICLIRIVKKGFHMRMLKDKLNWKNIVEAASFFGCPDVCLSGIRMNIVGRTLWLDEAMLAIS